MAILGNAGPVDPGGVFSAVLAAGKDKNLTLQQLRKFYTQLIQESIRDGDEGRESRLIQKYIEALRARYEKAAKKKDRKAMSEIASALWYGISGSFKCNVIVQNQRLGTLEAQGCGRPEEKERTEGPTSCDLTYQHYLSKVARLRSLAKEALAWRKQVKEEQKPYEEIIDLAFEYEKNNYTTGGAPLGETWDKLYTEENRSLVEETLNTLDRLDDVTAETFIQAYEKAEETGGKPEYLYLIRLAAQAKKEQIEADGYKESGMEEVNAELRIAYNELKQAEGPYAKTCNIEPSKLISENGGMFELRSRGRDVGPNSFSVYIYNEEGAVEDSFYV